MGKKINIVRRIELRLDTNDQEERKRIWKTLFRWRDICVQAANKAATHLYCQHQQNEFVYLSEKAARGYRLDRELSKDELKELAADVKQIQRDTLATSPQNTPYQVLSHLYKGQIPTNILSCVSNNVFSLFQSERAEYATGKRSLRNYRDNMPVPFSAEALRKMSRREDSYNGRSYENYAFELFGMGFQTWFGRDLSNNKAIWDKAFSKELTLPEWIWAFEEPLAAVLSAEGEVPAAVQLEGVQFSILPGEATGPAVSPGYYYVEAIRNGAQCAFRMKPVTRQLQKTWVIASDYKFCASSIAIENDRRSQKSGAKGSWKIFLLACFEIEKDKHVLDPTGVLECYLDPEIPLKAQMGDKVLDIGNKEEFLYRRQALQQAGRRLQSACRYNKPGVRRSRKLQALHKVKDQESSYVGYKIHMYSKRLVDVAVRMGAGRIILKGQTEKESLAKQDPFLLRNWGYYDLKTKIIQKAAKAGIEVEVE